MITTSVMARPPMITIVLELSSRPRTLTITVLATRPESAKTSPCAKLISCRMP